MTNGASAAGSRKGVFKKQISRDHERQLIERAQAGDQQACADLIDAYEPLINKEAKKWEGCNGPDAPPRLDDLKQEGRIGLMTAIYRFDLTTRNRISTYAMGWIRDRITGHVREFANAVKTGRTPEEKKILHRFKEIQREIENLTGEGIDDDGRAEIARRLNVSIEAVKRVEPLLTLDVISMEMAPPNSPEDGTLTQKDMVEDDAETPEGQVAESEYKTILDRVMHETVRGLPEPIDHIMFERWLQEDHPRPSNTQLAEELNIGRERVRLLEMKGKRILRAGLCDAGLMPGRSRKMPDQAKTHRKQPANKNRNRQSTKRRHQRPGKPRPTPLLTTASRRVLVELSSQTFKLPRRPRRDIRMPAEIAACDGPGYSRADDLFAYAAARQVTTMPSRSPLGAKKAFL